MLGSTPALIERQLTLGILRGDYPAGSHLRTVRALASEFGVNQATIQRVVARLETRGLIRARQGSGLLVNDAAELGDVSLMPYWIEAALDDPARATMLLDGFLEVRRIVATRLLVRHRDRLLAHLAEKAGEALVLLQTARAGTDSFRDADLAFARWLLRAIDNPVPLAIFNSVAKMLDEVPVVAQAMYAEPDTNLASIVTVMTALRGGAPDMGETIERAMGDVDAQTLVRFEQLLRARREP
jgi:GntR family transcriptional regulator, transcriptional repressor for pyruvate dehydrogenase complex